MKISPIKVELIKFMGDDWGVCDAARVSFHKEASQYSEEQNIKLINYLARNGHWSPFAHNSLQFRITAPVFVSRQMVKHQVGGVWNEVSRRYVDDEPEFYFPDVWRGKPVNAKQGSSDEVIDTLHVYNTDVSTDIYVKQTCEKALNAYEYLIDNGVAPEQARMILPQNTMTTWWWTGSLMFFARVCKQRLDGHAQQETREVAQQINDLIPEEFKHSWKALMQ